MGSRSNPQVSELASRIFIELASRVVLAPAQPDKPKPAPEVLARMSFKLAEAFVAVDEEHGSEPVTKAYEVKLSDVGGT
ncbi:MAG: hypothetical protein JNM90_16125 [Burkholderiales bacterium]|nr:hypothetical protein [Burkholderiales bacterium]